MSSRVAINLMFAASVPVVLYWQYHAVRSDVAKIEKRIDEAFDRVPLPDSCARSSSSNPICPAAVAAREPRIELPSREKPVQPELAIVRTNRTLHHTDRDLFCMAKNIYHEAAHEPDLGKYAVAQITLNRKYNPKYPKSICSVILDPFQFSWANDSKIRWTQPRGPAWEHSKKIAEDVILRGYRVRGLEHGMFYHADYVSPRWRDESAKIAKIGRHIFYSRAL